MDRDIFIYSSLYQRLYLRRYPPGKIVESRPSILLEDLDELAMRVQQLREETPKLNWDVGSWHFSRYFAVKHQLMTAGMFHVTNLTPRGSASPTRRPCSPTIRCCSR
jgi:hypothetical protein